MASVPTIKYRPSLSAPEIEHIISILERPEFEGNHLNYQCLVALRKFGLKAKYGIVSPSHVASGRATLEDSLGFGSPEQDESIDVLLDVWKNNPSILTPAQWADVQKHRYLSDLMTPEEEAAYEQLSSNT